MIEFVIPLFLISVVALIALSFGKGSQPQVKYDVAPSNPFSRIPISGSDEFRSSIRNALVAVDRHCSSEHKSKVAKIAKIIEKTGSSGDDAAVIHGNNHLYIYPLGWKCDVDELAGRLVHEGIHAHYNRHGPRIPIDREEEICYAAADEVRQTIRSAQRSQRAPVNAPTVVAAIPPVRAHAGSASMPIPSNFNPFVRRGGKVGYTAADVKIYDKTDWKALGAVSMREQGSWVTSSFGIPANYGAEFNAVEQEALRRSLSTSGVSANGGTVRFWQPHPTAPGAFIACSANCRVAGTGEIIICPPYDGRRTDTSTDLFLKWRYPQSIRVSS